MDDLIGMARVWARKAAEDRALVFHVDSGALGFVEQAWSGEGEDCHRDPAGAPVTFPVVRLTTGDCLLAKPEAFIVLTEREGRAWRLMTERLTDWTVNAVELAAREGVPEATTFLLVQATLRGHVRALEVTRGEGVVLP